ncbi:histidine phosphatase family protein [Curvibacter sp. HBC61]|uniref:Histidine phosphatase family protein n=1 Tax=Curvibacter cyanobacteriorum TaxID=3026422 RepID=A0ABT5MYE6_9BURK|nr:histidine phosphatase family protein [Curvibacter sp. HBC61]MDD0839074.1 histidine phosphatase family protein [Curvibacter sp. HBC61]
MSRLWLVRHPRPLVAAGVCYGRLDVAADPQHLQQVRDQLAQELPPGAHVHHSPRQRCAKLAQALCEVRPDLQSASPPDGDPDLAEMDFGEWEGQTWDALGEAAVSAWTADFAHHAPGGGETVNQVLQRVGRAWRHTQARTGTGQSAVWITHAGVIRCLQLLRQGVHQVDRASQWPTGGPACGEWLSFEWGASGPTPA